MSRPLRLASFAAAMLLAGCAALAPAPREVADAPLPERWEAGAPAEAGVAAADWWPRFGDPLLLTLIDDAQAASPTVAAAASRIAAARASLVAAGAALGPTLDASLSTSRGRPELSAPLGTSSAAGFQAAWELDLFGAGSAARDAARARADGARAAWQDAQVSVAAEVANGYLALRACEAQRRLTESDAGSREATSRLTALSADAGFQAPAAAALARASAAQARATLTQQRAACDSLVKALVALSGRSETALRDALAAGSGQLPQPAALAVPVVPGDALRRRPDVRAAERELAAALADEAGARAQQLPRITLAGNIGAARFSGPAGSDSGSVWTVGPLRIALPLFDGGTRRANADAAGARLDEAGIAYRATLRRAVREVEDALVQLASSAARGDDARIAAEGFEASYRATDARWRGGLASLFELEDARRTALAAQSALLDLQRERVAAWIALYRALGGATAAVMPTP